MSPRFTAGLFALALSVSAQAQQVPPSVRTFLDLEAYAQKLVQQPYTPPQAALDPFFDKLEYDGHRQIQFIQSKALFNDIGDGFRVEFSHPGWMFKKTIGLFQITDGNPAPVPYTKDLFFYGDLKLPEKVALPPGFSGWKLLTAKEGEKTHRTNYGGMAAWPCRARSSAI